MGVRHEGEAGFSLIEVMIALMLFSLISLAGIVLVNSILQVRERTEGRLDELGDLQRAMLVVSSDFEQARSQTLRVDERGASIQRADEVAVIDVTYHLTDGKLMRQLSGGQGSGAAQTVLNRVAAARWRIFVKNSGWLDQWPQAAGAVQSTSGEQPSPMALSFEIDLDDSRIGVNGTLRSVVLLAGAP